MISVLMPYWMRQEATTKALDAMAAAYPCLDMEIVIADDGSPVPLVLDREYPWPVTVLRLPGKTEPKNPCFPMNQAARAAKGDVLVITNPEILHEQPVLPEMLKSLEQIGSDGYVLAAAWCPERNEWHCHSSIAGDRPDGVKQPAGSGFHFCAMFYRALWDKAGGFDEAYREGAGYDDPDWVNRAAAAGAKFLIRDDLVVKHPKTGAVTEWPEGSFQRNRKLFFQKWQPLTIACVMVGDYCGMGVEYVRRLEDMIARNLDREYRFVCISDREIDGIETIAAPADVRGWWVKLYAFETLKDIKGPILFLDLDTVITGPLEPFADCNGDFIILRDFHKADMYGSALMKWEGDKSHIWRDWLAAGKPEIEGGDQFWIHRVVKNAKIWQQELPGMVESAIVHIDKWPSEDAHVVCFHGKLKPHNSDAEWVKDMWKVGGLARPRFTSTLNNAPKIIVQQVNKNLQRNLPIFKKHDHAILVGGGPSLKSTFVDLLQEHRTGVLFATNGTHDWLIERGVIPEYMVMLDSREGSADFVKNPHSAVRYLIAAQCHDKVFQNLEGYNVTVWANWMEELKTSHLIVCGGATVGMKLMYLTYLMGFRKLSMHGYDSSYLENDNHAYRQTLNDGEAVIDITAAGRKFKAARWMAKQAIEFQEQSQFLVKDGCEIIVHGDGLLPWVARNISTVTEQTA